MNPQESNARTLRSPSRHELPAWVHFVWLIYVGFLFMPLLSSNPDRTWFWPTMFGPVC